MLDIITATTNKRGELLSYIKSKVSNESYIWARNLIADVSKKVLTMKDDEFTIRAYPFYKNTKLFFTDVCDEVTPGGILLTLFLCSAELGVRSIGDSVGNLKEFQDEIDMDDWANMTMEAVVNFDMLTSTYIAQKRFGMDTNGAVWACGLHTLNLLDFTYR